MRRRRAAGRVLWLTVATAVMAASALACNWHWFLLCVAWPLLVVAAVVAVWPRASNDGGDP